MPDHSRSGDSQNGDADSSSGLLKAIRKLFDNGDADTSLRAQLEEAIDEHEDEQASGAEVPAAGDLSPVELTMLRNLLHFSEHDADDVAIPRGEIVAVPADASWDELVAQFAEHGHSRMPVYRGTLDEVIGMMHLRDVFTIIATGQPPPADWTTLMRQPLYVPQARGALDVLADMRANRTHLAIVVDEFSGTDGIITIEDLVEEIVGDIEDEHDIEEVGLLAMLEDGLWEADARLELKELQQAVDARLTAADDDVDTVGGLTFLLAGRILQPGESVEHPSGWRLESVDADGRRIKRVRLHAPEGEGGEK